MGESDQSGRERGRGSGRELGPVPELADPAPVFDSCDPDPAELNPTPDPAPSPDATQARRPRVRRRVTTEPVPGSDPNPLPEPRRHAQGENDEQLKRDKPPHWG